MRDHKDILPRKPQKPGQEPTSPDSSQYERQQELHRKIVEGEGLFALTSEEQMELANSGGVTAEYITALRQHREEMQAHVDNKQLYEVHELINSSIEDLELQTAAANFFDENDLVGARNNLAQSQDDPVLITRRQLLNIVLLRINTESLRVASENKQLTHDATADRNVYDLLIQNNAQLASLVGDFVQIQELISTIDNEFGPNILDDIQYDLDEIIETCRLRQIQGEGGTTQVLGEVVEKRRVKVGALQATFLEAYIRGENSDELLSRLVNDLNIPYNRAKDYMKRYSGNVVNHLVRTAIAYTVAFPGRYSAGQVVVVPLWKMHDMIISNLTNRKRTKTETRLLNILTNLRDRLLIAGYKEKDGALQIDEILARMDMLHPRDEEGEETYKTHFDLFSKRFYEFTPKTRSAGIDYEYPLWLRMDDDEI